MLCLRLWKPSALVLPCIAITPARLAAMHSLQVAAPHGEGLSPAMGSSMQPLTPSSSASTSPCRAPQALCLPPGPRCSQSDGLIPSFAAHCICIHVRTLARYVVACGSVQQQTQGCIPGTACAVLLMPCSVKDMNSMLIPAMCLNSTL